MRSLNSSLPRSNPTQPAPPADLLQAFKAAALSVTTLYKTSVTDQVSSRQAGYQDALEDLLVFLDQENIGLQDGEGWRIRTWATERYERAGIPLQHAESEDDRPENDQRIRSLSPAEPERHRNESEEPDESRTTSPQRTESAPPAVHVETSTEHNERSAVFQFSANPTRVAVDVNMQTEEAQQGAATQSNTNPTSNLNSPSRNDTSSRPVRNVRRPGNRNTIRSSNRDFTFTAGSKRKLQFPDFFDISNFDHGKDKDGSHGGGKRGRVA